MFRIHACVCVLPCLVQSALVLSFLDTPQAGGMLSMFDA